MSNKNRPSVLKREREQKKRQRQALKDAKAADKRARRQGEDDDSSRAGIPTDDDAE